MAFGKQISFGSVVILLHNPSFKKGSRLAGMQEGARYKVEAEGERQERKR